MSPFLGRGSLVAMVASHERITTQAAEEVADAGTDRLEREIVRRTPIDTNPFRHNPERPRGTARASIKRDAGLRRSSAQGFRQIIGDVRGSDPILIYIEFDTPPHTIRAHAGGRLRFQSRHGFTGRDGVHYPPGTWVSVEEVRHPGTKGQHMFSLGALATDRALEQIATGPLARWRRRVENSRF